MGDRAIKSSQSVQATITCCIKMALTSRRKRANLSKREITRLVMLRRSGS
jgi:hypothetical protein